MTDDIYILLPGILGSVLQKDGKDVFGLTATAGLRALFSAGDSITHLKADPHAPPASRLDDGVTASRLAEDAHLIPRLWKIDGYGAIGRFVTQRLKAVPGETYFEFPYDWRLDNRVAAGDLRRAVDAWLAVRRRSHPHAKVVLIAHSMGGLVARYYVEVLGGWRDTRALITIGTPHRGSVKALDFLANGLRQGLGLVDLTGLVRSFPSVYQLLPIYRCVEVGGGRMAYVADVAGQIGIDKPAVIAARAFHQEIEDAVAANRNVDQYREASYRRMSVISEEHPTLVSAVLGPGGLAAQYALKGEGGGDGTVPGRSTDPMEVSDRRDSDWSLLWTGTRHSSLQNAKEVHRQIKGWLTPTLCPDKWRSRGAPVTLPVALDDVYAEGESITATASPERATGWIRYRLEQVGVPERARRGDDCTAPPVTGKVPAQDGPTHIEIPPPGPGVYRLTLDGGREAEPVSDLLVVAPR